MSPTEFTAVARPSGVAKRAACTGLALLILLNTTSCGLLVSGRQKIRLNSTPQGAEVLMDGNNEGVTPLTVSVRRRDEPVFRFQKEGYIPQERPTDRKPNEIFILDIIGGVIWLVPFLGLLGSGGWSIEPNSISVSLQPEKDPGATAKETAVAPTPAPTTTTTDAKSPTFDVAEIKVEPEIVKPGETIKVRINLKASNGNAVSTPPVCEVFINREGTDLKQQSVTSRLTSTGGYEARAEFTLPTLLQDGIYEIRVAIPPNGFGSKQFAVSQ